MNGQTGETKRSAAPNPSTSIGSKAGAAPPKMTGDGPVEMENIDGVNEEKLPLHEDIMQLARLGEVGPVQKLFEDCKYDAKYTDAEGITPLHVCTSAKTRLDWNMLISCDSGQRSTTTMHFVNTSLSKAQMSTPKEANLSLLLLPGQYSDVNYTSFICYLSTVQILSSQTSKATICSIWLRLMAMSSNYSLCCIRISSLILLMFRDIHV